MLRDGLLFRGLFGDWSRAMGDHGVEWVRERVAGAAVEAPYLAPVAGAAQVVLDEPHAAAVVAAQPLGDYLGRKAAVLMLLKRQTLLSCGCGRGSRATAWRSSWLRVVARRLDACPRSLSKEAIAFCAVAKDRVFRALVVDPGRLVLVHYSLAGSTSLWRSF
jgi:hypothetical protein